MSVTEDAGRAEQICEALVLFLDAADAAGTFGETIGARRVWTTLAGLHEVGDSVVTLVAPLMTKRRRNSNGTYARYVVVDILVRVHLTADVRDDLPTMGIRVWLAERIDNYLAAEENPELALPNSKIAQYIEPTDERHPSDIREDLGVLWDADDLTSKRQQTVLVRVAYWVDEDY